MRITHTLLALIMMSAPAQAEDFDTRKQLGSLSLQKCSEAKLEKYFYDLGHVALYRQNCSAELPLTDLAVYVEFAYDRAFEGEDFAESANKLIKRNIPEQAFSEIEGDLNQFNTGYQSIKSGDRYAIAYSNATGLVLSLNNDKLISSDNKALARHYFTIWFGDKPFSNDLKNTLLKR